MDKDDKPVIQLQTNEDNLEDEAFQKMMKLQTEILEEGMSLVESQLLEMDKNTEGILFITYGNENYMVSGRAAHKVLEKIGPTLKKRHPEMSIILMPWWMKTEFLNIKDFLEK